MLNNAINYLQGFFSNFGNGLTNLASNSVSQTTAAGAQAQTEATTASQAALENIVIEVIDNNTTALIRVRITDSANNTVVSDVTYGVNLTGSTFTYINGTNVVARAGVPPLIEVTI